MQPRGINLRLGERLKSKRLSLGLTQTDVAKKCFITFQQIQKYEQGINQMSVLRLLQVCNALKTPVSYFLEDIEKELMNFDGCKEVHQDQTSDSDSVGKTS